MRNCGKTTGYIGSVTTGVCGYKPVDARVPLLGTVGTNDLKDGVGLCSILIINLVAVTGYDVDMKFF
jgi:hypothetical protein